MLCALLALAVLCVTGAKPSGDDIPREYIVVLSDPAPAVLSGHLKRFNRTDVLHVYAFPGFSGYCARMSVHTSRAVGKDAAVLVVEEDAVVSPMSKCSEQVDLPSGLWGLSRTSQRHLPINYRYMYARSPPHPVDVYVLDSGIHCSHDEFAGRCVHGFDATGDGPGDANGHGTHVAGGIAGTTFGQCKTCHLVEVKVLGRGSGMVSHVIAGVDYVANQHVPERRSVANIALGMGRHAAFELSVEKLVEVGVHVVVAAGNSATNACNSAPSVVRAALTVGSTDVLDARSSFSNVGTCVDIFAPGSDVLSAWIGSDSASREISGTSMSCGYASGAAAQVVGMHPVMLPSELKALLSESSTKDVLSGVGAGSPNELLFNTCEGA